MDHPLEPLLDPAMRERFHIAALPRGGGNDTVGNTSYRLSDYRQTAGSSFRMVLDVGNWDQSLAMNTPGQSGNPDSPHYRDLFPQWAADKSFSLPYSRPKVEEMIEQRLVLSPSGR